MQAIMDLMRTEADKFGSNDEEVLAEQMKMYS
jgi:hypothetical protein